MAAEVGARLHSAPRLSHRLEDLGPLIEQHEVADVGEEPIEKHHGGRAKGVFLLGREQPLGHIADQDPAPEV